MGKLDRKTAHRDTFVRDNLPPRELWPLLDFSGLPELDAYSSRMNSIFGCEEDPLQSMRESNCPVSRTVSMGMRLISALTSVAIRFRTTVHALDSTILRANYRRLGERKREPPTASLRIASLCV